MKASRLEGRFSFTSALKNQEVNGRPFTPCLMRSCHTNKDGGIKTKLEDPSHPLHQAIVSGDLNELGKYLDGDSAIDGSHAYALILYALEVKQFGVVDYLVNIRPFKPGSNFKGQIPAQFVNQLVAALTKLHYANKGGVYNVLATQLGDRKDRLIDFVETAFQGLLGLRDYKGAKKYAEVLENHWLQNVANPSCEYQLARLRYYLGAISLQEGDFTKAEDFFIQSIRGLRATRPSSDPEIARSVAVLAYLRKLKDTSDK